MATENILMHCVQKGGDRQELHEAIREHSVAVTKEIKLNGSNNNLLERILADSRFNLTKEELDGIVDPRKFTGCATMQTEDYLNNYVKPVLEKRSELLGIDATVTV